MYTKVEIGVEDFFAMHGFVHIPGEFGFSVGIMMFSLFKNFESKIQDVKRRGMLTIDANGIMKSRFENEKPFFLFFLTIL